MRQCCLNFSLLFILFFIGLFGPAHAAPKDKKGKVVAPEVTTGLHVFFQKKSKGYCQWYSYSLKHEKIKWLHAVSDCTDNVIVSPWNGKVFYVAKSKIFLLNIWEKQAKEKVKVIASLPKGWGTSKQFDFFITKKNQLRISRIVPVEKKNIKEVAPDKYIFKVGSNEYEENNPLFASPGVAEVYEVQGKELKLLDAKATQYESADAPGMKVVEKYIQDRITGLVNVSFEIKQGRCLSTDCDLDLPAWDETKKIEIGKLVGYEGSYKSKEPDGVGVLKVDKFQKSILFKMVYGDTPHYRAPGFFCENQCEKSIALESLPDKDIGALPYLTKYILIGEEMTHKNALIYEFNNPKPIHQFKDSLYAVWVNGKF